MLLDYIYGTSAANNPEPVFVNLLWIPRHRFPAWRAGTTILFVEPARQATYIGWQNRFLGSLNVYKYGLCFNQQLGIPSIKEDRRGEKVNPF
jgi:hypothetical protein